MHKKTSRILMVLAVFLLVGGTCFGAQASNSTTFNLSLYLNEYIETMPGPVVWDLGHTTHYSGSPYDVETIYPATNSWNLAYANCRFNISIAGENLALEHKPRFARLQTGTHGGGIYDTLPTLYDIRLTTNGVSDPLSSNELQSANNFPFSKDYSEAPHNGQVRMDMKVYVNTPLAWDGVVPQRKTLIAPAFTDQDSADAGIYTCTMVVTLGAL